SRSLYLYVKKAHLGVVPGLREYLTEFASDAASGYSGYLIEAGLLPLIEEERGGLARQIQVMEPMTGVNCTRCSSVPAVGMATVPSRRQLSIRGKIMAGYGLLVAILAAVAIIGLVFVKDAHREFREVTEIEWQTVATLQDLRFYSRKLLLFIAEQRVSN